jgi:hypothetical protein
MVLPEKRRNSDRRMNGELEQPKKRLENPGTCGSASMLVDQMDGEAVVEVEDAKRVS